MIWGRILAGVLAGTMLGLAGEAPSDTSAPAEIVVLGNDSAFQQLLGTAEPGAPAGTATYTYEIDFTDAETGTAKVEFDLFVGGEHYPMEVEGRVHKTQLSKDIFIQGDLHGQTTINGEAYLVDVGLRKLQSQDALNLGVNLTTADYNTNPNAQQILFYFGAPVMTEELWEEYQSLRDKK